MCANDFCGHTSLRVPAPHRRCSVAGRAMATTIVQLAPADPSQLLSATVDAVRAVLLGYGDAEVPTKHGRDRGLAPPA